MPLLSLDAIAFDSETTGLDTRQARMIQLGAVRIRNGQVDSSNHFQQLINPTVPIPATSQAIHGISDIDVATAPYFADVVADFEAWRQHALLVGYATGFDLAILKRETLLAGLDWAVPDALDIRYLVQLIGPNLPDFSLDTIAAWLGIAIQDRHSALGDSIATAAIFVELIPELRKCGIRTFAEAQRACDQSAQTRLRETQIGWLDIHEQRPRQATLQRIDSFPYRHRVRDLMTHPALTIEADKSLREALTRLTESEVSSLYVNPLDAQDPMGIITERDLLRQFYHHGDRAFDLPLSEIAAFPLESLSADAFVYRAIARMKRRHIRHLAVHDDHGKIIGALSARDLLRQRADDASLLGDDIDNADSAAQMSAVWGNIALVAKSLVAEDVDARVIAAVISRELCALTRQACILAEREMPSPPPCAYAMLVLGSGGRGESLLAMDQDNAIVFAAGDPNGPEDRWFAELGTKVADMLDTAGVPYCKGNIMASNPNWRLSLSGWQGLLQTWVRRKSPEDILNCDIFFDAIGVHGDMDLADQILDYAFRLGRDSTSFIKLMAINACKNRPPLGLFGGFKLDDRRMDLKLGGIMPLFSTARVLAIKHGIRVLSTPARFAAICAKVSAMRSTLENLDAAHQIIFNALLTQQLLDLEAGIPLTNRVAPNRLSQALRDQLHWALRQVPNVANPLGDPLSGG